MPKAVADSALAQRERLAMLGAMNLPNTRREFLKRSALAGAGFWLARRHAWPKAARPTPK
jgi:hypothetical protein